MQADDLLNSLEFAEVRMKDFLGPAQPRVGVILGSGLNALADAVDERRVLPFSEVPSMQSSTAAGHEGCFVSGRFAGVEVLMMQGRLHGYEGYSPQEVAFPVWLMQRLGIHALVTTNAAGALNEAYAEGDFCLMSDQINFTGRNPVACAQATQIAQRFFSMLDCFDVEFRGLAHGVAQSVGLRLHEGVYLGLLGPSYETPAEIRAFRVLGADTVAMSVCEEVIAARHVGMRVLGLSLITNMACGIQGSSPDDSDIRLVGSSREQAFEQFMRELLPRIRQQI